MFDEEKAHEGSVETFRIEKDLLGEVEVPREAYWGASTQRAIKNFSFTGLKVPVYLIRAYGYVKKAAAITNYELGFLNKEKFEAIALACDEVIEGKFDNCPLDALQGGAGTSTNMYINEVVANRATELLGGKKGEYIVRPIEDVNLHQSTNDTYPTALKVAALFLLKDLEKAVQKVQGAFQKLEKEFSEIVKVGVTELQEAVPITLGLQMGSYADAFSRDRWRIFKCMERIRMVNLGGTAVGTGLTAPTEYIFRVIEVLRELTGLNVARADLIPGETANIDSIVEVSGILKAHAANLSKVANDLRLMNFMGEIKLPALQAGSSVMPGKVNPVLAEAAIQVAWKVKANDYMIGEAASWGSFQINEFLPLVAYALLETLEILVKFDEKFARHVSDIRADPKICEERLHRSFTILTALLPRYGYHGVEKLVKEYIEERERALKEGEEPPTMYSFLKNRIGEEELKSILNPLRLTSLGYRLP